MSTNPFRAAVEARDIDAMIAELAEDIVFFSPVTFNPLEGREAVGHLLGAVFASFDEFVYTEEMVEGRRAWLRFAARVGEREVDGIDLMEGGEDGLIERFAVMVRPLSAATALAERVGGKLGAASQ